MVCAPAVNANVVILKSRLITSICMPTWKNNVRRIPKAAKIEKALKAGSVVLDPMRNAQKSVMEVTVIEAPDRPRAMDNRSATVKSVGVRS